LGNFESSITDFDAAIQLEPSQTKYFVDRSLANCILGNAASSLSDFGTAQSLSRHSVTLPIDRHASHFAGYLESTNCASESEILTTAGILNTETAQYTQAMEDFTAAIIADPNSSDAFKFRGFLWVQIGENSEALTDLTRAIEISPSDPDAHFKRAIAFAGLARTPAALDDLNQAISLAPSNPDYLYGRGIIFEFLREYGLAIKDFHATESLLSGRDQSDLRQPRLLIDRGWAYLSSGNPDLAFIDGNDSLRLLEEGFNTPAWDAYRSTINFQLAQAHQILGDALTQSGRPEEGWAEYGKATALR